MLSEAGACAHGAPHTCPPAQQQQQQQQQETRGMDSLHVVLDHEEAMLLEIRAALELELACVT
jgi:hypothetical protein